MKKYWFRPARFWGYFAFYYPSSWQGIVLTIFLIALGVKIFLLIDARQHSESDTLLAFAPWFISLGLIFDSLCFRKGEYPSWWKK